MTPRRFTDAEIVFTAVLGLVAVILGNDAVLALAAGDPDAPSLLSRLCPSTTIAPFWVFFVLLPSALGFIAIGIPYALRTVIAALRGKLDRQSRTGLLVLNVAVAAILLELVAGGSGRWALLAIVIVCLWQVWRSLARLPRRRATRFFGLTALSLSGLAYYEWALQRGAESSMAIAPTLYVSAFFFSVIGVLLVSVRAVNVKVWVTAIVGWLAVASWIVGTRAASLMAGDTAAGTVEIATTAGAAAVLFTLFLANEFIDEVVEG